MQRLAIEKNGDFLARSFGGAHYGDETRLGQKLAVVARLSVIVRVTHGKTSGSGLIVVEALALVRIV